MIGIDGHVSFSKMKEKKKKALRTDITDMMTLAQTLPCSEDGLYAWTAVHSSALDREGRVTAWRLMHGRLFGGAFLRHVGRGTPESHACPADRQLRASSYSRSSQGLWSFSFFFLGVKKAYMPISLFLSFLWKKRLHAHRCQSC